MPLPTRILTATNIDALLDTYVQAAETVGDSISSLKGLALLRELKRGIVGVGPYLSVALFEAANRIMTDLVILYAIRGLLRGGVFPFSQYTVELGHENERRHDIEATGDGQTLIGEAFNVARSFFAVKKAKAEAER